LDPELDESGNPTDAFEIRKLINGFGRMIKYFVTPMESYAG